MGVVNLKTLAKHLKLTQSTVSRALNNYPDISQATRERVKKAADEFGYKPNSNARRLATGVTESIGLMLSENDTQPATPFMYELMRGIGDGLVKRNWDLTVIYVREGVAEEEFVRQILQSGKVSGLILTRTLTDDKRIDALKMRKFPFVVHGRSRDSSGYSWYDIDNELAFEKAVNYLVELGHTKIAHIGGDDKFNHARLRRIGYRHGLDMNNLPYFREWDISTQSTDKCGYAATKELLESSNIPTAICCISDVVAYGTMKAIHEEGLEVGKDISVIGYDGLPFSEYTAPGLTTMAQPLYEAGREIIRMLLRLIDNPRGSCIQQFERATLIKRNSTGTPRE